MDEKKSWNGRQIFNAFQTAVVMAEYGHKMEPHDYPRPTLKVDHFKQIAKTSAQFEEYLKVTYEGMDDSELVANDHIRADSFGRPIFYPLSQVQGTDMRSPWPRREVTNPTKGTKIIEEAQESV
ncbi:hypothetical protein K432DRAFT_439966 [Lepidopterella palustris CBS 459.81]|uniref:AAA+ ATPase lid domain-containing protein n=1 Tax=Lepidopterella palustris CBS 459.81 TaxID=1314670 RepID=A0A8E2JJC6_9PEZI|nr:hypothetical protein K432DRAFT_439966 [Lepidopterella palustris CBS 459.81]